MTIPQFSLRQLLLIVTVAGILCLVPALTAKGFGWTIAPLAAFAAVVVFALVGAFLFAITGGVAGVLGGSGQRRGDASSGEASPERLP